jgi:ATP-dependent protease ClpP protease subunit
MQFALRGEKSETLELAIYDTIGESFLSSGVTARDVQRALSESRKARTINVRIHSAGGDVLDGAAIFAMLTEHPARVVVDIDGIAASIASFIAMAGTEIRMSSTAFFMVHNPWGVGIGEATDLRAMADVLDKMQAMLARVYAVRSGNQRPDVLAWMDAESWFTADEAKARGFVDKITEGAPRARAERKNMHINSIVPAAVSRAGLTSRFAELAGKILAERDPTRLEALLTERDALIREAEQRATGAPRADAQAQATPYHQLSFAERAKLSGVQRKSLIAERDRAISDARASRAGATSYSDWKAANERINELEGRQ